MSCIAAWFIMLGILLLVMIVSIVDHDKLKGIIDDRDEAIARFLRKQ